MQIARYLEPKDLLNLARTCITLRRTIMDRNSAFIWRRARLSIKDLPKLPSYLSEPAYAAFVFERRCSVSSASCLPPQSNQNIVSVF